MTESDSPHTDSDLSDATQAERTRRLVGVLRASREGFRPGFADRVMSRVDEEWVAQNDLVVLMRTQFRRWAPLALAAGLALAAFNVSHGSDQVAQSTMEALLGLEPVTLSSAYSIDIPTLDVKGGQR